MKRINKTGIILVSLILFCLLVLPAYAPPEGETAIINLPTDKPEKKEKDEVKEQDEQTRDTEKGEELKEGEEEKKDKEEKTDKDKEKEKGEKEAVKEFPTPDIPENWGDCINGEMIMDGKYLVLVFQDKDKVIRVATFKKDKDKIVLHNLFIFNRTRSKDIIFIPK